MNEQCKGANAELHVLQSEASLMFKRLAAASKLIDGKEIRVGVKERRGGSGEEGERKSMKEGKNGDITQIYYVLVWREKKK